MMLVDEDHVGAGNVAPVGTMVWSRLAGLVQQPDDALLALIALRHADPRANKIDVELACTETLGAIPP